MPETEGFNINRAVPANNVAQHIHGAFMVLSDIQEMAFPPTVQARGKLLMKTVTTQCTF